MGLKDKLSRLGIQLSSGQQQGAASPPGPCPALPAAAPTAMPAQSPPAQQQQPPLPLHQSQQQRQQQQDKQQQQQQQQQQQDKQQLPQQGSALAPRQAPPPSAVEPPATQQEGSSQLADGSRLSRLKRVQASMRASKHAAPPQASTQLAPSPSQRTGRIHIVGGRLIAFDRDTASSAPTTSNQQQEGEQQHGEQFHQQGQQQGRKQQGRGEAAPLLDRGAARAVVTLDADMDDFDHDPTEQLRQAGASVRQRGGSGRARSGAGVVAAEQEGAVATTAGGARPWPAEEEGEEDPLLAGLAQLAAKPKRVGRRGTAGKEEGRAIRAKKKAEAAVAAEAEAGEGGGQGGKGGKGSGRGGGAAKGRMTRKGAPAKRRREDASVSAEPYLELAVPSNINRFLRSYQRQGIQFLARAYARGTGAILADDMGLGKTVQAIGFIAALLGKTGAEDDAHWPELSPLERINPPGEDGEEPALQDEAFDPDYSVGWPILVVAPTSVLTNWCREFEMWGKFRVALCHGKGRDTALASIRAGEKEVMVVSYETLRGLAGDALSVPWHACIFDEAHRLKNTATAIYKVASRLPTRLRYGLTGTPFQNDYSEMWALLDFFAPGCLGDRNTFKDTVANPIMRGQTAAASADAVALGQDSLQELTAALAPYALRRTKKLIAHQMPRKLDYVVFCELSPLQLAAYKRVLESSADVQLLLRSRDPCPCGSGDPTYKCNKNTCSGWKVEFDQGGVLWPLYHQCECDNPYDRDTNPRGCKNHKPDGCWRNGPFGWVRACPFCLVLPVCSILRKISNHLELVKAQWEDRERDPVKFGKAVEVAKMVIGTDVDQLGGYVTDESFVRLADSATCGKMQVLETLLKLWSEKPGNKVLLFSNSVRLLGILRNLVLAKGYDFLQLDGSTPQKDRQELCDRFNHQPSTFLFLISTLAGGTGLNLTAANKVVIFDPSWNPASDLQAQDRAFRIGQKRDVSVYRFIAAGTLEDMVYNRQVYKQQQSEMVLEGAAQPRMYQGAKTGSKEDFGELWGMLNLIRLDRQQIMSLDLLAAERAKAAGAAAEPRVVEWNADEAVGGDGGGAGAGAATLRDAGGGDADVDAGLEALVEAELQRGLGVEGGEEGPEGGEEEGGAPRQRRRRGTGLAGAAASGGSDDEEEAEEGAAALPRALLAAEQAAEERWAEHEQETEVLEQLGVKGLMQHDLAMKPGAGGAEAQEGATKAAAASRQQRTMAAARAQNAGKRTAKTAAVAARANGSSGGGAAHHVQSVKKSLLHSLAELLGLGPAATAEYLLALSAEERSELRRKFAAADGAPTPSGGGSDGGGSDAGCGGDEDGR